MRYTIKLSLKIFLFSGMNLCVSMCLNTNTKSQSIYQSINSNISYKYFRPSQLCRMRTSSAGGHGLNNGEWLHLHLSPVATLGYLTFHIKQTLCTLCKRPGNAVYSPSDASHLLRSNEKSLPAQKHFHAAHKVQKCETKNTCCPSVSGSPTSALK